MEKMSKSFLAYFGHINIDVSIRVPVLPRVGSVNATKVSENFGGTAGNFAIISRKLGLDFDLYSAVSKKTHSAYLEYLSSLDLNLDHVDILDNSYGPVCYITSDGNDQVAYVYQGPMDDWSPADNYKDASRYEWVHFSTGPPEQYAKLFDLLGESKVTFDPGQEIHYRYDSKTALRFLERSDMFVGNEAEYQKLQELTGRSDAEIRSLINSIIITRGTNGVSAYLDGKEEQFSVMPAERVYDTIGAGDSFRAGLYLALWKGMSMADAIATGVIVSAKAIESPITEFDLKASDILELLKKNGSRIKHE